MKNGQFWQLFLCEIGERLPYVNLGHAISLSGSLPTRDHFIRFDRSLNFRKSLFTGYLFVFNIFCNSSTRNSGCLLFVDSLILKKSIQATFKAQTQTGSGVFLNNFRVLMHAQFRMHPRFGSRSQLFLVNMLFRSSKFQSENKFHTANCFIHVLIVNVN